MLKLIKNFTKKDVIFILISIALIAFQVYLELKMPDYMSEITKLVQSDNSSFNNILTNGIYMLLCALGSLVSAILTGYFISNIAASFSYNVRSKLFNKVESLSLEQAKRFSTSSLITRTTNDITQIQMLIAMGLQMMIKSPITAVWAVTKILNKSFEWSALTGLAIVILLTTIICIMIIVVPKFKIVQKLTDKVNGITRENLTGIRVVRAFNAEKYQEDKFEENNNKLTNLLLFNQKTFAIMQPMMYLVLYFLTLAIYLVGARLIQDSLMANKITIFSDMVVFSSYAMLVIISFLLLAVIFMMLPRAQVSAGRINEVLDLDEDIKDGKGVKKKDVGTVEFKNVSFKYSDAEDYLLENISFKVSRGETVAFIGSTGSGKSTLINLIPRFYEVNEGSVLVDGVNVKEYKEKDLHNIIGYVSQKAFVFNDSIKANIRYGENGKKEISEEKIEKALDIAQASEFVNKMENKMNSHIAQSGINISGGQKQRLSIARAIARDPEIYIFDDTFSALDYKTDLKLRTELKKHTKDATVLIVAQRIGTIMNADKIIVLDNGKCVGMGTHKELLKKCKVYKEIALSQLSKEELQDE